MIRSKLFSVSFLVLGSALLGINFTNISSIYSFIATQFNQTIYGLGILTSAFFLFYGLFEVPGGIFAIRRGPKKIAVLGLAINAASVILSSFSPQFWVLVALRAASGLGAAFAFPALLVLIVEQLREGSAGRGSGWMIACGSIGSAVGLFVWPVIAESFGWRVSVLLSGLLDVLPLVAIIFFVTIADYRVTSQLKPSVRKVLFDKTLLYLAFAFLGGGIGFALISNFMVFYLEKFFGLSSALSGLVAAFSSIAQIIVSPIFGWLHDTFQRTRLLLSLSTVMMVGGVIIISTGGIYTAALSTIIVGSGTGIFFTLGLGLSKGTAAKSKEYESLAIAWVDSFSLFGGFISPLFFSLLVLGYGYSIAWLVGGLSIVVPIMPFLLLGKKNQTRINL